jgi:hypothetical protein
MDESPRIITNASASLRARKLLLAMSCAALLLAPAIAGSQAGSTGSGDCDPGLRQPEGNPPNAYAQRSGRCEGIYAREIAAANLGIASFTRQFDSFDANTEGTIRLDWKTPAPNVVHIRATSLKPRSFYRMDALRAAGADSWLWPTDILKVLGIDKTSLGVVATTTVPLNGIDRAVYLPLRISAKGTTQPSRPYEILLRSDVELSEVFVSIAELDKQGKPISYLRQNKPLLYGIYPAERGIPVAIGASELREGAIYQVDVGATLRTGGSANTKFWIYGGI